MASLRHSGVDFALAASSILLGMPTSTQTEWLTVSEAARLSLASAGASIAATS